MSHQENINREAIMHTPKRTPVHPITLNGRRYFETANGSILSAAHLVTFRARYVLVVRGGVS